LSADKDNRTAPQSRAQAISGVWRSVLVWVVIGALPTYFGIGLVMDGLPGPERDWEYTSGEVLSRDIGSVPSGSSWSGSRRETYGLTVRFEDDSGRSHTATLSGLTAAERADALTIIDMATNMPKHTGRAYFYYDRRNPTDVTVRPVEGRAWQVGNLIVGGILLLLSFGCAFGIVHALFGLKDLPRR